MKKHKSKKRPNYKTRARNAAIRLIAKEDGISFQEARAKYKRAVVDVIFRRPELKLKKRFIEIQPGKFRAIPPGKRAQDQNAVGPIRTIAYVKRVRKMQNYWATIHILQDTLQISLKQARAMYKRKGHDQIMIDLGLFAQSGRS